MKLEDMEIGRRGWLILTNVITRAYRRISYLTWEYCIIMLSILFRFLNFFVGSLTYSFH